MNLLIFGFGFTGRALARLVSPEGWRVIGSSRSPHGRAAAVAAGVDAVDPDDEATLEEAALSADAILVASPPDSSGCPALRVLGPALQRERARPLWIGYLSTTGVYGDRGGRWVSERTTPHPASPEAQRRVDAETAWSATALACGARFSIFRLPGIYGPGRSALDRVRAGDVRRLIKPGHVFSRIHVEDLAAGLYASIRRPARRGLYNLCDDVPAPACDVTTLAAQLLGIELPPEQPFDPAGLSPMAQRFWAESKRVSNARAKAELGWRPACPSYREGLAAIVAGERDASF